MLVYMHSWRQVEGVSWQASSRWRSSITGRSILSLNGNNWGTWKARTDFKSNNMLYMCLWCCILSNFLDCKCNILTISKYNAPLHINEQWVYHGMLPLHLTWKRFFVQLVPQDRKKGRADCELWTNTRAWLADIHLSFQWDNALHSWHIQRVWLIHD